jgi:triphosphatase
MEIELKLAMPAKGGDTLLRHAAFREAAAKSVHQVTRYFDTADETLRRAGFTLRVRHAGNRRVQTLKAAPGTGVAMSRGEWEWDVAQDMPDLALLAETPARSVAADVRAAGLAELVATVVDRRTWLLHLAGGTRVEAAFDTGRVTAGERHAPLHELELELKSGDAAPLYRLALELHAMLPMTILAESKAARGFALRGDVAVAAIEAEDVMLGGDLRVQDGFRSLTQAALGHMLANAPAARAGLMEGIHQIRVAARRLRALLVLFAPLLEPAAAGRFNAELRRLGEVFGQARNWDVFCAETLTGAGALTERIEPLRGGATGRRAAAHRALAAELDAPAFTSVVLGVAAWAEGGRAVSGEDGPLARSVPALLDRLAHKVDARAKHLARLPDEDLHALRKSLKKLRYGIDFVVGLYPGKAATKYLDACKDLQEVLGAINDSATAVQLAEELCQAGGAALAPAMVALARHAEARREAAKARLTIVWDQFAAQTRFWS